MPFIGIIAKDNDYKFIRNEIIKNAKNNIFDILNINKKSIINIKNIKFDCIIINEGIEELLKDSAYFDKIIKNTTYIIINSDIKNSVNLLNVKDTKIITYGFNTKSSLTVSSIKDENVLICVQRNIERINKKIIEVQEMNVKIEKNNVNKIYNTLAIFAILQIYGEKLQKI